VGCIDRSAWAGVVGSNLLEVVENVFRAVGRPQGQEVVVCIQQGATATHGDKSGVTLCRRITSATLVPLRFGVLQGQPVSHGGLGG